MYTQIKETPPVVQKKIRILLVEDNAGDARLMLEMLRVVPSFRFGLKHVGSLVEAKQWLATEEYDVVLLDLSLPDSQKEETFRQMHETAPQVPIVVLTGWEDGGLAGELVHEGAQDYLVKQDINSSVLVRVLLYAIERQKMLSEIYALSLADELTGLYNRKGFLTLAAHQIKVANRFRSKLSLFFIDLDKLKWINDSFGHREGDAALKEIANILKESFREADIVARLGGDEFVVLAQELPGDSSRQLIERLNQKIEARNAKRNHAYELSISMGQAVYDPKNPKTIEMLLERADDQMYRQKRLKKSCRDLGLIQKPQEGIEK